jgi:hypothetical protein
VSSGTEYFIAPRVPGVRPVDDPDYDGITFVYVFTRILDVWTVPPITGNVDVVVDNSQGFVPGMTIAVEGAGYYQVVQTTALNRMTIENLPHGDNAFPGSSIPPGNITTTSLPGPKGDKGDQGIQGLAATVDVGTTVTSPAGQNANVVNAGTPQAAILNFTIPRGLVGPQGPQGAPGQAFNATTGADFTAANPPTVQVLTLNTTTGLFQGVVLNIDPIGYYQVQDVISPTQCHVVNTGTATNAPAGTVSPSGSNVLGTGPEGPPGTAATIAAGNTTTLPPGNAASVTQRGTPDAAIFDFGIPQGVVGPQGNDGAPGAPGAAGNDGVTPTVDAGTTSTLSPGQPAAVTQRGTPTAVIFDFAIPEGDVGATGPAGAQGPQGTPGAAATITAGNTSTSAPGSNALVTQRGTAQAAIFDFAIPRGDVGATGLNAFTITSGPFTVPAVGSTVVVTVNDASFVVVGQMLAVQGAGGTGIAGSFLVQSKTGNQLTLLNPATSQIPLADSTHTGLLKQLSGNTTDYVDGTNNSHPLANVLGPALITGNPDAPWIYGAYDDHFDGSVLAAKWVPTDTAGYASVSRGVSASRYWIVASAPADATSRMAQIVQAVSLTPPVSIRIKIQAFASWATGVGAVENFFISLYGGSASSSRYRFGFVNSTTYNATANVQQLISEAGANYGTLVQSVGTCGPLPPYWRLDYNADKSTQFFISFDGFNWCALASCSAAQTLFATTPPDHFVIGLMTQQSSVSHLDVDWVRFQ